MVRFSPESLIIDATISNRNKKNSLCSSRTRKGQPNTSDRRGEKQANDDENDNPITAFLLLINPAYQMLLFRETKAPTYPLAAPSFLARH